MNVIVISAHPDDEVLGCGGTLAKHRDNGDKIYWIITTGIFEDTGFSKERVQTRREEIDIISSKLGIKEVFKLGYPTMTLTDETLIKMIPEIGRIFNKCEPEVIYVLNRSDAHSDHLITFKATFACTKSFRYPFVKKVLMYECISETEFGASLPENVFIPNYFVNISNFIEEKITLMKVYESEMGIHPFPRSIENIKALAHFRGASVGVKYAEAFQLLKFIDK
jgi:LmbE family N-acetylglucosaminyl deacetylase